MRWDRWKLGAGTSVALSLFVALAGLTAGMGWRAFAAVLGAALATHFGAFLKDHPTDNVVFDGDKTQSDKTNEK
jgi:hypothetical protein